MNLPFVSIPDGHLGPIPIHPFGLLVATGIIVGNILARKRAHMLGIPEQKFESLVFWTVGTGIVLSHVLDTIFYHPDVLVRDPLELIKVWNGLSSFGGFFGAALGFWLYTRRAGIDRLRAADAIAYGLPVGWLFGRAGCAVVHDHPGRLSHSWFAVDFGQHPPGGVRFDLGLIEFLLTPLLILTVMLVARATTRQGAVIASLCLAYAPIRFGLDFLRAGPGEGGDPRYGGLTPGQWACFILLGLGVYLATRPNQKLPALATTTRDEPGARVSG